MAAQLKDQLGLETRLVAGSGGEFEVVVDGDLIYSKRATGEFPDEKPLIETVKRLNASLNASKGAS